MMQQLELHLEEAIETEISQTQRFCLINACFAKKSKYKPNTKTREKLHSVQEFRADKTVRECASLHVKQNTDMSEVAREVIGICAKDLISSEAKYHASCYKNFVRIIYSNANEGQRSNETDCPLQHAYEAVYRLCENFIANPDIIEYKVVKELFLNKASELVTVSESHKKNLMRTLSTKFPEIIFIAYQYNKVSMCPNSLTINKVVLDFFRLKTELESLKGSMDDNEKNMIKTALLISNEIKDLEPQMCWPPKEDDLKPSSRAKDYIPNLLDVFLTVLISGKSLDSDSSRTEKNNKAERIFRTGYCFFLLRMGL